MERERWSERETERERAKGKGGSGSGGQIVGGVHKAEREIEREGGMGKIREQQRQNERHHGARE